VQNRNSDSILEKIVISILILKIVIALDFNRYSCSRTAATVLTRPSQLPNHLFMQSIGADMRLITTGMEQQVLLITTLDSRNSRNLFPRIKKKLRVSSLARLVNISTLFLATLAYWLTFHIVRINSFELRLCQSQTVTDVELTILSNAFDVIPSMRTPCH